MTKLFILVMCMPFFAACTNENEKNHDLMIRRYFNAAVGSQSRLNIRSIVTHSQKNTAYTSVIRYQYTIKDGQRVSSKVTIETVGTNQNYIVVNGDCISTEQLAYELKSRTKAMPSVPPTSGNSRREMESKYMKSTPEFIPSR